jgi:hypothetical protein
MQASWFRAEDAQAAKAAAETLKFSVIEINTDADKALTSGVHEGVLKDSGRMIVGSVTSEVYRRIEDYARKGSGASAPQKAEDTGVAKTKATSEQNVNTKPAEAIDGAAERTDLIAPAPNRQETFRVGSRVLAAHWNEQREFEGFWLATVKRIDKGEFTLEWFDAPEYPPFKTALKNIAAPHPEFRVSGK